MIIPAGNTLYAEVAELGIQKKKSHRPWAALFSIFVFF